MPQVFQPKYTIKDMQWYASQKDGRCLSKEYWNNKTHLTWQCNKGHVWEACPTDVIRGSWCRVCVRQSFKHTIEEMQELAAKHRGKCLSKVYINNKTKLKWQCVNGHTFETTSKQVLKGVWCERCRRNIYDLKMMQEYAAKNKGKCLSKKYVNTYDKLHWQCKEGHRWWAVPKNVINGAWCAQCAGVKKHSIELMKETAKARGGKCLSKAYINNHTKLTWQCKNGHQWQAAPKEVLNNKTWCAVCSGRKAHTIEEMKHLAKQRGGKCLSDTYKNNMIKLRWKCKEGHIWESNAHNILSGKWCIICGHKRTGLAVRNRSKENKKKER